MKFLPFIAAALLLAACTQQPVSAPRVLSFSQLPTVSARGLPGKGAVSWYRELLAVRLQRIEDLEAYAQAGAFPQNPGTVSGFTPVFVDARNVPCAVAHLMRKAGAEDLVEKVRKENDLLQLWTIKEGEVMDWILTSGLTHEECALIQPSYDHNGRPGRPRDFDDPDYSREVAVLHIQGHLHSTAKKLRADTLGSLVAVLQRLQDAGKIAGDYCVFSARSREAAMLHCSDEAALLIGSLQVASDGKPMNESHLKELASGAVATPDWAENAASCIVEMFDSAKVVRGSPLG